MDTKNGTGPTTLCRLRKTSIYLVPVLMHTLDILELFSEGNPCLKVREVSVATGVSQTTVYRILHTLVHRGYAVQDLDGRFCITGRTESTLLRPARRPKAKLLRGQREALSGEDVIDIVHSIIQALRDGNTGCLAGMLSKGRDPSMARVPSTKNFCAP